MRALYRGIDSKIAPWSEGISQHWRRSSPCPGENTRGEIYKKYGQRLIRNSSCNLIININAQQNVHIII